MHDLVNVVCGNTRPRLAGCNVQHFASQPADLAHALLLLLVQNGNLVPVDKDLLGVGYPIFRVVRQLYVLRYVSSRRERVDGSERAGIRKCGKRIEVTSRWVRVRNYFWSEDALEYTILRLVRLLMLRLARSLDTFALAANFLTMYPVALEAVLRAEVALLAQLLAVWALQRARLVLAVRACALPCSVSHGGAGGDRELWVEARVVGAAFLQSALLKRPSSLPV